MPKNRLFGETDAGAAELHGADLVAVAIEHVGERHDERDPQTAVGDRPPRCGSSASPAAARRRSVCRRGHVVGRSRDELVDLAALDAPLEHAAARRASYLPEHRLAGLKHEEEPAGRIDERDAAVQREVHVAVVFVAGRPQRRRTSGSAPPRSVYSVISAPVSGCDIRIDVPVYCSDPMPFSTALSSTTRGSQPARQQEAADAEAGRREDLDALAVVRRVGDDEGAVRLRRRTRSDR